jgi:WhiB family transcriptional regulator, redox-sensing transcriptional regulator
MTAEHPPSITVAASTVEPPADPRPAWERVAYTWLAREVDGGHQVDPAALAAEVSVSPRLATDLVRVLRAQRQRDPCLGELRGRLVRDQITDAYLTRELMGGAPLDAAELTREVGTTTTTARQWLHTLRAARSGDPRLATLRTQPASHGQPTPEQLGALQAAYAGGGRPDPALAAQPAGGPLERIEQTWRTREVGHGEHLDAAAVAREVGVGRAYAAQTLAALRGGELTNTERITQLWRVVERDGGQRLDAPAVARMLGVPVGRVRQVLGPLRTQQRQAADQQTEQTRRLPLVPGEGRLGWMDQAACKGLPTERFFPETGEGRKATEAKAICATCQVQEPCRELAVRGADSLEDDYGVFGGTVPTERSQLRPNRFPEPSAYRQDRAVAERAHELASRVGLRQAASQLGVSRDTLKTAWAHWAMPQPAGKPGIPPSRFLADRAEAERAFRLAEELGSINAAAAQLGTTWPSLRKAFQRHQLGTPQPNPAAVNQRKSAVQLARLGGRRPTAPALDPVFVQLNPGTVPPARGHTGTPAVRLRRAEEIETLGFGVVADMNTESRARRASVRHRAVQHRAERAQQLVAERASRPQRRQAERQNRAHAERAERSSRPHHPHLDDREVFPDAPWPAGPGRG